MEILIISIEQGIWFLNKAAVVSHEHIVEAVAAVVSHAHIVAAVVSHAHIVAAVASHAHIVGAVVSHTHIVAAVVSHAHIVAADNGTHTLPQCIVPSIRGISLLCNLSKY